MFVPLSRHDRGATAIEYALIAGLIGLGLVGSLSTTKAGLNFVFGTASSSLGTSDSATVPTGPTSTSARAPYWSAKSLAKASTVSQSGKLKQTYYNYTDGTQVSFIVNTASNPVTYTVTTISADHLTTSTTSFNANGVETFRAIQSFRSDANMSAGLSGVSQADPSGNPGNGTTQNGYFLSSAAPLAGTQFTSYGSFSASNVPLSYTNDMYNASGGWVGKQAGVTPTQYYLDMNTIGTQDFGYFKDITP